MQSPVTQWTLNTFRVQIRFSLDFPTGKSSRHGILGEDLLIELDGDGKIVSLTVEHAGEHIDVSKLSYDQVPDSRGGLISRRTEALC